MTKNATDVLTPLEQEGTQAIVKSWYKSVGETITEGDPLVELETDKVSVEVPAPASGVVSEILITADGEAEPGSILGRIHNNSNGEAVGASNEAPAQQHQTAPTDPLSPPTSPAPTSPALVREHRLSPSVRRLVSEHNLDPSQMNGTGKDGRLTRADVQAFLENTPPVQTPSRIEETKPQTPRPSTPPPQPGEGRRIPHDTMRRRIAEHMSHSVATAPHVTAVFEADFTAITAHRARHKGAYAERGVNLTYTAYIVAAAIEAMKAAPAVNSRWHDDFLEVFDAMNIGVGTALGDKGLIVPVIRNAQSLSLFGLAEALHRLTDKARTGALTPEDVRGGTFSISNHGVSGSLVATPIIINQPQSAILGVGKLEKRVVVREVAGADAIQIRPMAYVSLTIDHRVIDGAQTNAWLTRFVETLETWPNE
ncbi:MAG: 2-oxo acid dehydrogenase subunit E2 [Pseudomonadota bacterium]